MRPYHSSIHSPKLRDMHTLWWVPGLDCFAREIRFQPSEMPISHERPRYQISVTRDRRDLRSSAIKDDGLWDLGQERVLTVAASHWTG